MSVWDTIGVNKGNFCGVNPCSFVDNAFDFFSQTAMAVYKSSSTSLPDQREWMNTFTFDWCSRRREIYPPSGVGGIFAENFIGLKFGRFDGAPMFSYNHTFVSKDQWNLPPAWDNEGVFIREDKDALGGDVILHPLVRQENDGIRYHMYAEDLSWQTQRYELIQQLRYMIVPMTVFRREGGEPLKKLETGYLDFGFYHWVKGSRIIKCSICNYWTQPDVTFKIGVLMKKKEVDSGWNVIKEENDSFWLFSKEYETDPDFEWSSGYGVSRLYIFAVVDLASHPDFAKYFDI